MQIDKETVWLVGGVVAILLLASSIGFVLSRRVKSEEAKKTVQNLNARTRAWWIMVVIFGIALLTGGIGSILLFAFTSFMALREFITLTPTTRGDHRTLFWAFFIVTPLQYWLVAIDWYGLFSVLIPVYAFLFLPIR
ncbi:MAG: phosphatidate cytidylyltransferase, partial [Limisphaerales bacterium]